MRKFVFNLKFCVQAKIFKVKLHKNFFTRSIADYLFFFIFFVICIVYLFMYKQALPNVEEK